MAQRRRLADDAIENGCRIPVGTQEMNHDDPRMVKGLDDMNEYATKLLRGEYKNLRCAVVDVSNVADYTESKYAAGVRTISDLPPFIPPWDHFWMEAPTTLRIHAQDGSGEYRNFPTAFGALFRTVRDHNFTDWDKHYGPEVGWVLDVQLYLGMEAHHVGGPILLYQIVLDKNGNVLKEMHRPMVSFDDVKFATDWGNEMTVEEQFYTLILVACWALAFMNCANVVLETPSVPAKVDAKHQRKHGRPKTRYSRIRIDGISRKGGSSRSDAELALHTVRGHFAHYGDCCPGQHEPRGLLFGKITGRFVVPMHVRGNPEHGTTVQEHTTADPTGHPTMENIT